MITRAAFALMFCLMVPARPGLAAVNSVAGLTDPMDNTGVSARAVGMGSAFVGVADDSSALLWNPSGLAGLRNTQVALHHNSWLAGIIQETAVIATPVEDLGGVGLSASYVTYGTFEGHDDTGAETASYDSSRYGIGMGWGMEVMTDVSVGIGAKGAVENLAGESRVSGSADLGALWYPVPNLRLGLSYSNLGPAVSGYSLASTLRAGGSYRLELAASNQLLVGAAAAWEPNGVSRIQVGAEDMIASMLAIRAGYQASLSDNEIEGLTGVSAGAGFVYESFSLDYAFLPFGDLGTTHRISLGYTFGGAQ